MSKIKKLLQDIKDDDIANYEIHGLCDEIEAEFEIYKKHHDLNCPDCCTKEAIIMDLENKLEERKEDEK